jgi:hypothetical protein
MTATSSPSFVEALHAEGPAADRADKLALYGQFVGRWDMDVVTHEANGNKHAGRGQIHFGWVLEGRAIQDVWMIPPRQPGKPDMPIAGNWYGTTLRVYDPSLDAWHIFWIDPATQYFTRQIGRARGKDIVQEGEDDKTGAKMRWSFTEITPDSFHWMAERSADGASWQLQVECFAHRTA